MNLHINYTPSVVDFDKLCGLLYTEINESSSPLFNIKLIRDYYEQGNLGTIILHDTIIGFAAWREEDDQVIHLAHIWIEKSFRGQHLGKQSLIKLLNFFRSEGYLVATIDCVSQESCYLSKSCDFIPYEVEFSCDDSYKYLPLFESTTDEKLKNHRFKIKYYPEMESDKAKLYPQNGFIQELPLVIDTPGDYVVEILDNDQVVVKGLSKYIYKEYGFRQLAARFLLIEHLDK